jgi:uncharacterized membrane protein
MMTLLITGLLVWSLVHFIPSLAPPLKLKMISQFGKNGYKLIFALLIFSSLALIVFGWRSSIPSHLYLLPAFTKHIAMLLVVFAFILFGASNYPTRIKNFIRHPQLTGVIVWAFAHLMLNGDSRSVLLFGGMGLWAILEIIFINRREGQWVKQAVPGWGREIRGLVISLVVVVVVVMLHPYIAGVSIK